MLSIYSLAPYGELGDALHNPRTVQGVFCILSWLLFWLDFNREQKLGASSPQFHVSSQFTLKKKKKKKPKKKPKKKKKNPQFTRLTIAHKCTHSHKCMQIHTHSLIAAHHYCHITLVKRKMNFVRLMHHSSPCEGSWLKLHIQHIEQRIQSKATGIQMITLPTKISLHNCDNFLKKFP